MDTVDGHTDHVHCLFRLKKDQCISKVIQLIKGESSFWINKEKLIGPKFNWQDEYFAVSVSESQVNSVRNYVQGQEEHHNRKTFTAEYNEFVEQYSFQAFNNVSS